MKTIDEIHEKNINDKEGRKGTNDLYKKVYSYYSKLLEKGQLNIQDEINYIELKTNKNENIMFNYYSALLSGISSGILVALITVLLTSDDFKLHPIAALIGLILVIGAIIFILFLSKKDIKNNSNKNKYYATCLLVLNDLK
ncbi:hypothetical protein [Clostridium sp.]|uniref:hypothetical protein n=1 Tax=Clostridium sp. TaxID=1506 RepID=UPI0029126320|nr:hypothetical protein [Clostridium sp.]MDU4146115.1 hypothetical protein [Clostridium sp.]